MLKIQIEQIDSLTTNGNLKVIPNGTGIVEVSGDDDSSLQLDNVKIKAPPSTAQQNTALVLPQNNIEAGKYLKVDSITGSGSTAVGQLSYATVTPPTADAIDASNFTSGTLANGRYSIPGSAGGGLQLVSKNEVTTDNTVNTIDIALEDNTNYKLIGKNVIMSTTTYFLIRWLNSTDSSLDGIRYTAWTGPSYNYYEGSSETSMTIYTNPSANRSSFGIEIDINNQPRNVSFMSRVHGRGDDDNYNKCIGTFNESYGTTTYNSQRIHKVRIASAHSTSYYFQSGTTFLLYKYNRE